VRVDELVPECRPTTVEDLVSDLRFAERAPAERPYLALNMVESIDGRTTLGGRVGALTGPVDQAILYHLRAQAEALLVGAGTVRNERYANIVPDGLGPQPIVVIVSGRVDLPPDLPLLHEPRTRIVIATSSDATLGFDHEATVEYLRLPGAAGRVDPVALGVALRSEYGIRSVVCEGGPTLNESLIAARVVDELFLALSPLLVGAGERTLADAAPLGEPLRARLLSAATADDFLFLRYEL
jgi:riboflavin-specific deaminase-like protein